MTSNPKKAKVEPDLLTDIDMLLLVEKGIRSGICCAIYQYMKANNKYMKDINKELSYLKYWDVPEGSYKQTENTSQFSKDFTKNYNNSDEDYFLEFDFLDPEKLDEPHNVYPLCLKE